VQQDALVHLGPVQHHEGRVDHLHTLIRRRTIPRACSEMHTGRRNIEF
jgi:hypothetical protein